MMNMETPPASSPAMKTEPLTRSTGSPTGANQDATNELLRTLIDQMTRIEADLGQVRAAVVEKPPTKEWYTPDEVAKILGKSKLTIREHCRFGRINAKKRQAGRGATSEWAISHAEVTRIQNEGLLPLTKHVPDRL